MRKIVLFLAILLYVEISAGVFPLPHLDLFSQVTIKYISATKVYQQSGEISEIPQTEDVTYSVYGELGFGSRYSLLWSGVFLKTLTTEGGVRLDTLGLRAIEREGFAITALGDLDVGLKVGLLEYKNIEVSISLLLGLSGSRFQKTEFFDQKVAFQSSEINQSLLSRGDTIQFNEQPDNEKFREGIPVGRNDYVITGNLDMSYSIPINTVYFSLIEFQGGMGYQWRGSKGISSVIGSWGEHRGNTDAMQMRFSISVFIFSTFYLSANWTDNVIVGEESGTTFDSEYGVTSFSSYTKIIENIGLVTAFELGTRSGRNAYSSSSFQQGIYVSF